MTLNRRSGFTLMEVLIAVAILGLVAAGALRLMIMGSRSLAEVEDTRALLNAARRVQLDFMTKELTPARGSDEDCRWDTREGSWPILEGQFELPYKELTVETKTNAVTIYMPTF